MKNKIFFIIFILSIIFNISAISIFSDSNNIYLKNVSYKFINYYNNLLNVLSKENRRFIAGYKQGFDTSCGIATVATLLKFFYNINLDEKTLINKFFKRLEKKKDYTISFHDIKLILKTYNFKTKAYKVELSKLKEITSTDWFIPVIIHFKKPEKHFTLYIGSYYQYNFIVDPSIGVYILDDNEFSKRFSGFIMLCKSINKEKNIELIYNIKSLLIKKINILVNAIRKR